MLRASGCCGRGRDSIGLQDRVSYMHHSLPPLLIQVYAKFGGGTCSVCDGRGLRVWERREGEGGGESAGARDFRN
jgi:hypothetical protein